MCAGQGAECPPAGPDLQAVCALALDMRMPMEPTHCVLLCDLMLPDPGCPPEPVPMQPPVAVCTAP